MITLTFVHIIAGAYTISTHSLSVKVDTIIYQTVQQYMIMEGYGCCIYGSPPLLRLMDHDIIRLTTQLEMLAECACMRTRHTLNVVYKSIQAST